MTDEEKLQARAAFVKKIKKDDEDRDAWAKTSLKARWNGPLAGFASDGLNARWNDFLAGWEAAKTEIAALKAQPVQPASQDAMQEIASYIGVGGYNGATTEMLVQRIKDEFYRLTAKAQPVQPAPLTDAEIDAITEDQWGDRFGIHPSAHRQYARAIEAAVRTGGAG